VMPLQTGASALPWKLLQCKLLQLGYHGGTEAQSDTVLNSDF
jgi:hypothetical protein